jgi:hypothetical protein
VAQLIVTRATGFYGRWRRLEVDVDDAAYGTLTRGERGRYRIHAGRHTVKVRMDWCSGSLDIDCEEDDVVYLRALPPPPLYWLIPIYGMVARRRRFFPLEIDELGQHEDPEAAAEGDAPTA